MRRIALPLALLFFALSGSAASAASPTTARYSLVIHAASSGDVISGTGQIDDSKRLASFEYTYNGFALSAIIVSSPEFVAYVRQAKAPGPWDLQRGSDVGALMDPGLALRLGSLPRRALAVEQMDGVRTTKYAITIPYPASSLLTPPQILPYGAGRPVTAWIDASGAVHRMHAELGPAWNRIVIDERLAGLGAPVQLTRPRIGSPAEPQVRATLAESVLDVALFDVRSWFYDHGRGYAGMTTRALRTLVDVSFPDATVVRATATTYCIQATVNGITKHQNVPKAPYASGGC
jgi:hypothetical protein